MAGKYEAEGPGLHGWANRKNVYNIVIVVAAVALAGAVWFGLLTMEDIASFIDLAIRLVGVLGSLAALVAGALAKANVEPPSGQDA